jgi:hypothetical protein
VVAQIDKLMIRRRPRKVLGRLFVYAFIEGRALTTKGRWINPLVFAGYRLAQWLPSPIAVKAPIFIVGTGRSGTTILGNLFSIHRETMFLNEPKAIWHFAHGHEDIVGSYSSGPAKIRLGIPDDGSKLAVVISKIYSWALFWGGARRIVDKYPELVFRHDFVLNLFPDARFIAIIRDGVNTCSSVNSWSKHKGVTEGLETHDWWGRDDRKWHMIVDELVPEHDDLSLFTAILRDTIDHRDRAAVEWIISMREAYAATEAHPNEILCVRYEDLCSDPTPLLRRILDHCGLREDIVFSEYSEAVLEAVDDYSQLELMPELVEPFRKTLDKFEYTESFSRVVARQ